MTARTTGNVLSYSPLFATLPVRNENEKLLFSSCCLLDNGQGGWGWMSGRGFPHFSQLHNWYAGQQQNQHNIQLFRRWLRFNAANKIMGITLVVNFKGWINIYIMWIVKGLCPVSTADWICNKGNLEYVVVEGESINLWFVEKKWVCSVFISVPFIWLSPFNLMSIWLQCVCVCLSAFPFPIPKGIRRNPLLADKKYIFF